MSRESERFFSNRACPHFPCHAGADREDFNCLFCYCPLYALGPDCGGAPAYTPSGVKDCSGCLLPHTPAGYEHILGRCACVAALARRKDDRP